MESTGFKKMTPAQVSERSGSLHVNRLSVYSTLPRRASHGSAGFDMFSKHNVVLMPGIQTVISTGLQIFVDPSCYGKIESRSSLAVKGVLVLGGVIDSDYHGEVEVILMNTSLVPVTILTGEAYCQLILIQIVSPPGVTDCSGLGIARREYKCLC